MPSAPIRVETMAFDLAIASTIFKRVPAADPKRDDDHARAVQMWHQIIDETCDLDVLALPSDQRRQRAGPDYRKLDVGRAARSPWAEFRR